MTTTMEYALLAGDSYYSTRSEINRFPIPDGWSEDTDQRRLDSQTGFEARAFQKGNEIVISFAGTDLKSLADIAADVALFGGRYHAQLLQAAKYYLDIKAANPNATITLTGHSLGGGLAALVAVFFGESATTFDQAPFASAAKWLVDPDVATTLLNDLQTLYPATPQGDPLQGLNATAGHEPAFMREGTGFDTYIQTTGDRGDCDPLYGCHPLQSVKGRFAQAADTVGYLAWLDGYSPATWGSNFRLGFLREAQ